MNVDALTGPAIAKAIPELARLRIAVFAEWPYLYDGDRAYEEKYLRAFAEADDAVLVTASDGGRIVGASTASPMTAQERDILEPMQSHGLDPSKVFYFGESVLLPEYRGQGLGHAFFDQREAHARDCGARHAMFAAVVRPQDHPARPGDNRPLDAFWQGRGYEPAEGLTCQLTWQDHGEAEETAKPLQFWMRQL